MSYESYAEYFHDVTKYTPEGVASSKHSIDFNKQPTAYKQYQGRKKTFISHLLPLDRNPFSDAGIKNPDDYSPEELSLAPLSKLLYLSNGITAVVPYEHKPFYMRSAPSAGGLYPTETYLLSSGYPGLKDGIYNFQVIDHSLIQLVEGDFKDDMVEATFDNEAVKKANLSLILTAVFYRSSWRYQDRAYRRICLDTGHIIGNINVASNSCGFKAIPVGGFIDKKVNSLLALDESEEQALAVIPLLEKDFSATNTFCTALPSKFDNTNIQTRDGGRLLQLHNRSHIDKKITIPSIQLDDLNEKFKFSPSIALSTEKNVTSWKNKLIEIILKRRSTRVFSGDSITKEELTGILDFAYHPEFFLHDNLDTSPLYFDSSVIDTFIAVNNVNGLEEGCYYFSPENRSLRQIRFKNFSEDIYYLCLGQDIGHKASAVIFHTCDLSKLVYKYGERAYRYIHLDAGAIGQRINLAAVNLELGVSGIGGFFDDQVNDLLGIPNHEAVVYITVLGVPDKSEE